MPKNIISKAIAAWQSEADKANEKNNELVAKIQEICATGKQLAVQLEKAKESNNLAIAEYKKSLKSWEEAMADYRPQIEEIDKNLAGVSKKMNDAVISNEKIATQEKLKTTLIKVETEMAQLENEVAYNDALLNAINRFEVIKTELTGNKIAEKLNRISLKLFEVTKTTSEIKPVFNCYLMISLPLSCHFQNGQRRGWSYRRWLEVYVILNLHCSLTMVRAS